MGGIKILEEETIRRMQLPERRIHLATNIFNSGWCEKLSTLRKQTRPTTLRKQTSCPNYQGNARHQHLQQCLDDSTKVSEKQQKRRQLPERGEGGDSEHTSAQTVCTQIWGALRPAPRVAEWHRTSGDRGPPLEEEPPPSPRRTCHHRSKSSIKDQAKTSMNLSKTIIQQKAAHQSKRQSKRQT